MGWGRSTCALMAWAVLVARPGGVHAAPHLAAAKRVRRERSALAEVTRRAMPAVVAITTHEPAPDNASAAEKDSSGLGSGFIVSPDGYILTSAHVIEGAKSIEVQLLTRDGSTQNVDAQVVGQDKATDSALLKIDVDRRLPTLRLGSAKDIDVADWVVVIGNPFGLASTVTVGVVSYKGRSDISPTGAPGYLDYLQTDAAINPGSSGGPILDSDGRVIAIANAVNVSGQGIGFGIPIDVARAVLPQLRARGSVIRAWVGVSVQDLTPELSSVFHVRPPGVVVAEVVHGSPAWEGGLKVGDVIVSVDSERVRCAQSLRWRVTNGRIGSAVRLRGVREGHAFVARVKLAAQPPGWLGPGERVAAPVDVALGAAIDEVDAAATAQAGLSRPFGALVRDVRAGSALEKAGLLTGDVILKVNRGTVSSRDEGARLMAEAPAGPVHLLVRRSGGTVVLELQKP
jgi:serine protease Do